MSRSTASALKFLCVNKSGNGGIYEGGPVVQHLGRRTVSVLSDVFFNADHDELIEINIFLKRDI